jgi:O-succinylbenzoate synthase
VPLLTEHRLRIGDRAVTLLHGDAGWGECSPLPGYPCDPSAARRAAEEAAVDGWPPAVRASVPVNALVSGPTFDPDALVGFPAVKVKVGSMADLRTVAAVRDAIGEGVALRVDANGAWDVDTAVDMIAAVARFAVELVEQPVASLDDLARVRRRVAVPIAADECVRTIDDARRLRAIGAADVVVLKVQPLGGVRAALDIASEAGVPAIVSSMMETSVGIAAGLVLAAALPELRYACGLATLSYLAGDVVRDPLVPVDGRLTLRSVEPDPELLARYQEVSARGAGFLPPSGAVAGGGAVRPGAVGAESGNQEVST